MLFDVKCLQSNFRNVHKPVIPELQIKCLCYIFLIINMNYLANIYIA